MKIVDRYITNGFLWPFLWCLFLFIVMAVITDIFSFIDDIVKFRIPLTSIAAFYVYYCPNILIQITPMAMLLATIYILSNLNKNNEVIAMRSSGISLWRVLMPILLIGLLVSLVIFIVNDRIVPASSRIANVIRREELEKAKRQGPQVKAIDNVAIYGAGNRIVFAKSYDAQKKVLNDIIIHEHDASENLISKITAQRGEWTGYGWKFYKIIQCKTDNSGKMLEEPRFYDEAMVPLKEKPQDFAYGEWRADFMSYRELRRYIDNFRGPGTRFIKSRLVDLHYKVSFAFISLIIVLLGAPFALITTRGGVLIGLGMSIAIGLLYYAVIAIALAFGKAGVLPPFISAWFGNVVFAILGVYLINKRA